MNSAYLFIKKFLIEIIFLIILIYIIFFDIVNVKHLLEAYFENTGLYFYSSLLQANAAILAIVGVFFIFRIQSLQSAVEGNYLTLLMSCVNDLERKFYHSFRNHSLEEKIIDVENGNYNEDYHKRIMQACIENIKNLEATKDSILFPSVILAIAILLNSFGILLSNYLHLKGSQIEIKIFSIVLLFQIYCLFIVLKGIISAIKS
jgi:hypothetical protein